MSEIKIGKNFEKRLNAISDEFFSMPYEKEEYYVYSDEEALELERRFINSIRTGDAKKFRRGISKIKESKKHDS